MQRVSSTFWSLLLVMPLGGCRKETSSPTAGPSTGAATGPVETQNRPDGSGSGGRPTEEGEGVPGYLKRVTFDGKIALDGSPASAFLECESLTDPPITFKVPVGADGTLTKTNVDGVRDAAMVCSLDRDGKKVAIAFGTDGASVVKATDATITVNIAVTPIQATATTTGTSVIDAPASNEGGRLLDGSWSLTCKTGACRNAAKLGFVTATTVGETDSVWVFIGEETPGRQSCAGSKLRWTDGTGVTDFDLNGAATFSASLDAWAAKQPAELLAAVGPTDPPWSRLATLLTTVPPPATSCASPETSAVDRAICDHGETFRAARLSACIPAVAPAPGPTSLICALDGDARGPCLNKRGHYDGILQGGGIGDFAMTSGLIPGANTPIVTLTRTNADRPATVKIGDEECARTYALTLLIRYSPTGDAADLVWTETTSTKCAANSAASVDVTTTATYGLKKELEAIVTPIGDL